MESKLIEQYHELLIKEQGKKIEKETSLSKLKKENKKIEELLDKHKQAMEIAQFILLELQKFVETQVGSIVDLCLDTVFDSDLSIELEFLQRRNQVECDIHLCKDGIRYPPMDSFGGGVLDIVSFALRIANWKLSNPQSDNVIILDEPFKFLSKPLQVRIRSVVEELSSKLGIQFIIITHETALITIANALYYVEINNGITAVIPSSVSESNFEEPVQ